MLLSPQKPVRTPRVVLLIESSRASGRALLAGVANYARLHGPWTFYWEPAGLERVGPQLRNLGAQGIILRDVDNVAEVLALRIPAVVIEHAHKEVEPLVNVVSDSERIGQMAAEHLLDRGLRHFAYCGLADVPWSVHRGQAFSRRLAQEQHTPSFHWIPSSPARPSWRGALQSLARWLKSLPRPLGLMACNDDQGQHVIEACKIAGLHVPEEVAIIGADNDELVCELSEPRLSSVALNFERAGYESAQVLDEMMHGRPRQGRVILVQATHIVTRHSTDIVAIDDPALAKAVRFIREHAREPLQVNQVAKAAAVSRRILETRFRRHLNRSVLEEIRRVRVRSICQMLAETNLPVSAIALALGFSGPEHFARYFQREMRQTPLAYRRGCGRK